MLKQAHYFIAVLLFILLLVALLTFFISFQMMPPQEEEIPRRSRPVFAPSAAWDEGIYAYGRGINDGSSSFLLSLHKK